MGEPAGQYGLYLEQRNLFQRNWWIFRRALVSAYTHNCFGVAKGAAYSALLSFFPVLTTATTILVRANADAVSRSLSTLVFQVVPPGTEDVVRYIFMERGHQPVSLIVIASFVSVWAASGIMMSLMEGFRAAYRIPASRPFLKQRGMAALLVVSAAVPIWGASALIVFGSRTEKWLLPAIGLLSRGEQIRGWLSLASELVRLALAAGAIVLGTCLLYYLGPNHVKPRSIRSVMPGALLVTVLWGITTMAFAWYVRNIANYNVLYGSIGAAIALLVWMYLLSVIALVGCEYNAEKERFRTGGLTV
jgi:membrane protein